MTTQQERSVSRRTPSPPNPPTSSVTIDSSMASGAKLLRRQHAADCLSAQYLESGQCSPPEFHEAGAVDKQTIRPGIATQGNVETGTSLSMRHRHLAAGMNQPEVLKISSGPRSVSARTAATTTKSGDREDKNSEDTFTRLSVHSANTPGREVPGSRTGNPKRLEHHHDHQDPNSIPQDAESLNVRLSSPLHKPRHQPPPGGRGAAHDRSVDQNDSDRIKSLMTNLNSEIRARGEVKRRFPQQVAGSAKTASLEALIVKDAGPAFYSDLSRRSQPLEVGKPPNHFGSMLSRQPEPAHLLMQMPHTGRDPLFEELHQLDNGLGQGDENNLPFHDRGNPLRAPEELSRFLSPVSGLPLPAVMASSSTMRASRRQFTCGKAREVKIFKPGKASLIKISRGKSRSFSVDSLSPAQADLMLSAGAMAKSARQPYKRTEAMRHSGVRGVAFNGRTEAASAERDHQESRTSRVGLDFEEPRPQNQVIGRFSNDPKDEMRFRKLLQRLKPNDLVSSEEARIAPVQASAAPVSDQPSVVSFADIQWTTPRSSSLKHKHGYFDLNDKPTQSPVPKDNGSTLTSPHQNSANSHRLSGKSGCPSLISDDGEEPCDLPEAVADKNSEVLVFSSQPGTSSWEKDCDGSTARNETFLEVNLSPVQIRMSEQFSGAGTNDVHADESDTSFTAAEWWHRRLQAPTSSTPSCHNHDGCCCEQRSDGGKITETPGRLSVNGLCAILRWVASIPVAVEEPALRHQHATMVDQQTGGYRGRSSEDTRAEMLRLLHWLSDPVRPPSLPSDNTVEFLRSTYPPPAPPHAE